MDSSGQPQSIVRSESRLIAGVCGGLAEHLGIAVNYVRICFLLLTAMAGAGVVLYAWLWVFTPSAGESQADELRLRGTGTRSLVEGLGWTRPEGTIPREMTEKLTSTREVLIGVLLFALAMLGLGQWVGLNIRWDLIWPSIGIVGGVLLAWLQVDGKQAPVGVRGARAGSFARLGIGLLLVIGGLLAILSGTVRTSDLIGGFGAAVAIIAGAVVVLLPWGARLWRDYLAERSSRHAASQRAEFAAHLHDSVLQTLAVIQKRAAEPAAVRALARSQERELRQWLYGDERVNDSDVVVEIQNEAAQIEELMLREVEVVSVGSAQGFTGQHALVQASREAMMNAAKHATGTISVFVECRTDRVEAFIRDRGAGFDVKAVSEDRQGIRESIVGRMQRAGGTAKIRSNDQGTEIHLSMPRVAGQEEQE